MRDSDIDTLSADGAQEAPPDKLRALAAAADAGDSMAWGQFRVAANPAAITALLDERDKALWDMGIMAGRVAELEDGLRALIAANEGLDLNGAEEARALLAVAPSDRCPVCLSTDRSPRQRGQPCPDSWHVADPAAPSEPPPVCEYHDLMQSGGDCSCGPGGWIDGKLL